jgi:hypothetical protein
MAYVEIIPLLLIEGKTPTPTMGAPGGEVNCAAAYARPHRRRSPVPVITTVTDY